MSMLKLSTYGKIYVWEPQQDITAYELALVLPVFIIAAAKPHFIDGVDDMISDLPEEVARHIRVVEQKEVTGMVVRGHGE